MGTLKFFSCILPLFLILTLGYQMSFAEDNFDISKGEISITAKQQPLKDILKQFSEKAKWTIEVDEKLSQTPISGLFVKNNLRSFIQRALKGYNVIVLYDKEHKTANIALFGEKDQRQIIINREEVNPIPPLRKQKELLAQKLEDQKAIEAYNNNPNSIEPVSGMPLGKIASLQAKEKIASVKFISNPNSIDPFTGMTLQQIATLRTRESALSRDNHSAITPPKESTFVSGNNDATLISKKPGD